MTAQKKNLPYLISTALLTLMMLGSAGMYFAKYDEVSMVFNRLGYPTYVIYPLAVAKLLGLVAIWSKKSSTLRGLAYAGFFYDFVLAASGHIVAKDGEYFGALMAMVLLGVSYFSDKRS